MNETRKQNSFSINSSESVEITISKEAFEIEAQESNLKNMIKWAVASLSEGLLYQGILGIGFVSLVVFLGQKEGFTYFWSFVFLALSLVISNIITLIFGLIIGTISDIFGKRKIIVLLFTSISIVLFASIASWLNFYFTIILFILGNSIFQISRIILNSQIPFISDVNNRGKAIGLNGVFNFLGSSLAIVITLILLFSFGEFTSLADIQSGLVNPTEIAFGGIRWIFPICAFIMLLSLIPYYFSKDKEKVEDRVRDSKGKIKKRHIVRKSFKEIRNSSKDFIKNKNFLLFLVGWFLVSSCLTIITVFFYEFIKRLIEKDEYIILLIIGTIAIAAIFSSYITGVFNEEIGPKVSIAFNILSALIGIIVTAISGFRTIILEDTGFVVIETYYVLDWWLIFLGAFFIGMMLGGFWVIGKQFVLELSPPKKIGQAFGILSVVNQLAAVCGTLLFYGIISFLNDIFQEGNSYRISLLIILGILLVSIFVFVFVSDVHPRYLAGERAPYRTEKIKLKRKSPKINSIVKFLYRLEYIYLKFNVIVGVIKTISWFVVFVAFAFEGQIPFYYYLIAAGVGIPALASFVYFLDLFGGAWQAELRAQFEITESELFWDQVRYNMLKNAISTRMEDDEKVQKTEKMHQKLNLDYALIEYEILQEIKKINDKKKLQN